MTSVLMAFEAITAKKGRSFLTMLGIIIGVCAVLVLVALVSGYNADITAYYEKLGVNKVTVSYTAYGSLDITDSLKEYCEEQLSDKVAGVTPNLTLSGNVKYRTEVNDTSTIYLGSEEFSACNNYTLKSGRDITQFDVEKRNRVCIIGSYAAQMLFGYSDPIDKTVYVNGEPITVVGVYYQKDGTTEESMDDMVVMPYSLNRIFLGTDKISSYIVKADKSDSMDSVMSKLEEFLADTVPDEKGTYTIKNGNSELSESNDETASLSVVLGGIAGIALLVGGIGIMNIMLVTVTERTREIGIKKAIGARREVIISQFLVEAAVLSALGGITGIILGYVLSLVLGKAIYGLILYPSAWMAAGAFVFSIAIGIGFGLYPAVKAASLQPVDALRAD